jgi:hypothetical protein
MRKWDVLTESVITLNLNSMADYFTHDSNARSDTKMIALRMKHKWEGYGLYWALIERLRDSVCYKLPIDYNVIAYDLRSDASVIKSIIKDFGLFSFTEDGECFYSESLLRRMKPLDEKKEKAKVAANARWGKAKDSNADASQSQSEANANGMLPQCELNADALQSHCETNANVMPIREEEIILDKNNINTDSYSKNLSENKFSATKSACEGKNETLVSEAKTADTVTPLEVATDLPHPTEKENPIIPPVVENPNSGDLSSESGITDPPEGQELPKPPKKGDKVDFAAVVKLYHSNCTSYPQVFRLTDARKDKIRIRMEEFSKGGLDGLEVVKTIFEKMQESKFLRGDNKRGWKASFDWVFENQKNWVKIIEGTYDEKTPVVPQGGKTAMPGKIQQMADNTEEAKRLLGL